MSDQHGVGVRGLRTPSIEVDYDGSDEATYPVRVVLRGWHDHSTHTRIEAVLAAFRGSVLVDLRDCDFIPRSTTLVIVAKARELHGDGKDLHVVIPPRGSRAWRTGDLDELVNIYSWLTADDVFDLTGRFDLDVP